MKKIAMLALALSFTVFSCSSDDGGSNTNPENPENPENPQNPQNPENPGTPAFAMTAKINGTTFQANNPFGTNVFSSTNIFNYYPLAEFVLLQARQGGVWGNPEINLWLKRSDIEVGTYVIGQETFSTPPSHFIDLIDNSNDISESTKQGTVTITSVNTTTHIVKGTFEFKTVQDVDDVTPNFDFNVTQGTFNYKYE